jgi:hypothetical protein
MHDVERKRKGREESEEKCRAAQGTKIKGQRKARRVTAKPSNSGTVHRMSGPSLPESNGDSFLNVVNLQQA